MKQKGFIRKEQKTGELGEDIAVKYLKSKGFHIIQRNFRMKFGEIDVICEKSKIIHFVEVKTVSRITTEKYSSVTDKYRPEDKMSENKQKRQKRVIEAYINSFSIDMSKFQIDLLTILLDKNKLQAKVGFYENIII